MRKQKTLFGFAGPEGPFLGWQRGKRDENPDTGKNGDDPIPVRLKPQRIRAAVIFSFSGMLALSAFVLALPVILERLPAWILAPLAFCAALALAASLVVKADVQRLWNRGLRDETARMFSRLSRVVAVFTVILILMIALFHVLFRITG